jgi:hypothetical protein
MTLIHHFTAFVKELCISAVELVDYGQRYRLSGESIAKYFCLQNRDILVSVGLTLSDACSGCTS